MMSIQSKLRAIVALKVNVENANYIPNVLQV